MIWAYPLVGRETSVREWLTSLTRFSWRKGFLHCFILRWIKMKPIINERLVPREPEKVYDLVDPETGEILWSSNEHPNLPEILNLLEEAKGLIRVWHGMGLVKEAEKAAWEQYNTSPEMKRLNTGIAELRSRIK